MAKRSSQHCLSINYQKIIAYYYYIILIMTCCQFNCIISLGVPSMDLLNENTSDAVHAISSVMPSIKPNEYQQDNFSSMAPLPSITSNVADSGPIQGWECYCWNSTNGYEVLSFKIYIIFHIKHIILD